MPVDNDGLVFRDLTFTLSSEGALDFVEELQVRESDGEVVDKCVVQTVLRHDRIKIPYPRFDSDVQLWCQCFGGARNPCISCAWRNGACVERINSLADCASSDHRK